MHVFNEMLCKDKLIIKLQINASTTLYLANLGRYAVCTRHNTTKQYIYIFGTSLELIHITLFSDFGDLGGMSRLNTYRISITLNYVPKRAVSKFNKIVA